MSTKPTKPDKYPWEVGMIVACESSGAYRGSVSIGKVARLTKTKVFVEFRSYTMDFARHNGEKRESAYHWFLIRPATKDDFDGAEHQKLAFRLSKINWHGLSLEQLERINTIVEETKS